MAEESALQGEVRSAVDRMAHDLRQAHTGDSSSPIETMTSTQVTFLSLDDAEPYHVRRVSYRLSGGQVDRALAFSTNTGGPPWTIPALGSWVKLLGDVKNSAAFTYLDANGVSTTNPLAVKTVVVTLVVATKGRSARQLTYKEGVTLRSATA
jgi:hypothetical protein